MCEAARRRRNLEFLEGFWSLLVQVSFGALSKKICARIGAQFQALKPAKVR